MAKRSYSNVEGLASSLNGRKLTVVAASFQLVTSEFRLSVEVELPEESFELLKQTKKVKITFSKQKSAIRKGESLPALLYIGETPTSFQAHVHVLWKS